MGRRHSILHAKVGEVVGQARWQVGELVRPLFVLRRAQDLPRPLGRSAVHSSSDPDGRGRPL